MNRVSKLLKSVLTSPAIIYMASRYGTYLIQFINSLFIAVYLGPFYLGVWGFIQLIIQYIAQINFGIPHAVNVMLSINKNNEEYSQKVIGNSIGMLIGLSISMCIVFALMFLFNVNIGAKFNFFRYTIPVILIGILGYFNGLFSNIFRVYGKLIAIAVNQSLFPFLMIITVILFKGNNLLWALLLSNLLSVIIAFFIYIFQRPICLRPHLERGIVKKIQKIGWFLFLYNTSFYLIIISTRSLISGYYSVEEFGYFTFTYSLAQAIILFLESMSYLILPKLINRFANSNNLQTYNTLERVRNAYVTLAHFLIHIVIFIFPLFLLLFPKYDSTFTVFSLTALTVVLYTNAFGFSGLLQARGKEKKLGLVALLALCLNIILAYTLIVILGVSYEYAIIATLLTYLIYTISLGLHGLKSLSIKISLKSFFNDIFQWRIMIPYFFSVTLILFNFSHYIFLFPILIFLLLNYKQTTKVKAIAVEVIHNPNFINI